MRITAELNSFLSSSCQGFDAGCQLNACWHDIKHVGWHPFYLSSFLICLLSLFMFAPTNLYAKNQILASNDWFMVHTPIGNFTDEDTMIFTTTVNNALNSGKKISWNNPHTGASGTVTPLSVSQTNGMRCREVQVFNQAKGMTSNSKFKFCRINGEWKILD